MSGRGEEPPLEVAPDLRGPGDERAIGPKPVGPLVRVFEKQRALVAALA